MSAPALRLDGVTVRFPVAGGRSLRALHRLDLQLQPGRVLALIGESGSGKSTAGRVICRLVPPTEGRVLIDDQDVIQAEPSGPSRAFFGRVQLVFQDPFGSLNPAHTVAHHVGRPLLLHGKATRAELPARVAALLERCGLKPGANFAAAYRLMTSEKAREAFDLSKEPLSVRERYGMTRFGQSCLLARRLPTEIA